MAAARRVVEGKALALYEQYRPPNGDSPPPDILGALVQVVAELEAFKAFVGRQVAALEAGEWQVPDVRVQVLARMYHDALGQTARILVEVAKLGIETRRDELHKEVAEDAAEIINCVLGEFGVDAWRREDVRARILYHVERIAARRGYVT